MSERERGERCQHCGRIYQTIYRLPNDLWDFLSEEHNLLCPDCVDTFARDRFGIHLYWEACEGAYPREVE